MALGRCGQMDAAIADRLFFGVWRSGGQRHDAEDVEAARNICGACPAREGCLADALAVPDRYDRHGIVAGLLPEERRALRPAGGEPDAGRWTGETGERAKRTPSPQR